MTPPSTSSVVRPAADRPSWRTVLWRSVVVTVVTALALWLLAAILPGFSIDSFWDALLAGFVVGVANAVVWPALAFLVVPLSVLTLGLGAIVLNALFVFLLLDLLPGVEIDGFWTALWVVIGLVIVTTMVSALLAIDDNSWLDQRVARQARRRFEGRQRHRRARRRVHPARRCRPRRAPAGAALRRRAQPASLDPRRQPRPRRVGDRVVVADRRQPVRDPARLDRRHAGLPLGRQVDRRGDRVQPSEVRGGDRAGPLRRQRPARPQRLELRQPVLRRRRAGRADDERRRPAQGGPHRRRLLRLLLAARPGDEDDDRGDRRDRTRAAGGEPATAPGCRASRRARLGVRPAAHVHHGHHPRRVGAGRHQRHVRGAGHDLRRHARLRRGRPPLRARTGRRAGRAARPRPPGRPHRAHRDVDAAAVQDRRAVRPRPDAGRDLRAAHRPDAGRARRRAVRRGGLGRQRCRGGPHRVDGVAAPRPPPRGVDRGGGHPTFPSCSDRAASA